MVETKPDLTPVIRGRPRGRAGAARAARRGRARTTRSSARSTARSTRRPLRGAGSSIRSTAPRATCAGSRCGRPCSRWRTRATLTVGVVSAPALRRRWWASRGAGAFVRDAARRRPASAARVGDRPSWPTRSCASAASRTGSRRSARRAAGALGSAAGARAVSATSGSTCWSPRGGRDLRRPDRLALGPGRAERGRPGGRRSLHRLRRRGHRRRRRRIATNGLLHEAALSTLERLNGAMLPDRGDAVRRRRGTPGAADAGARDRPAAGTRCPWPPGCGRDARRARRPGTPARGGLSAAARDRGGTAPLDDPARTAGQRQDDAGAAGRGAFGRGVRGGERGGRRAAPRCAR